MTYRATTCLGDNTVPVLRDLVDALRSAGVDIEFDEELEPGEREQLMRSGGADLVWACGLLTVERIDAGLDLRVVAAPVFAGESGPVYRSVIVVRADDPATRVSDTFAGHLAVNELGSWSGYRGLDRWLGEQGLSIERYRTMVLTGGHRRSARAVAEGVADVAAIDHTVWDHLQQQGILTDELRVVTATSDWPAPPFSVKGQLADELRSALVDARPAGLERIEPAHVATYQPMLDT